MEYLDNFDMLIVEYREYNSRDYRLMEGWGGHVSCPPATAKREDDLFKSIQNKREDGLTWAFDVFMGWLSY
jgi:hypothetical protein